MSTTDRVSYGSVYRDGLFDKRVIVITGGGSGIGRCLAHELVHLGARVALVGRNEERLKNVQSELGSQFASIHTCDVRNEAAVKETVDAILNHFGQIDGLVNNAGGQFPSALRDLSLNGWNAVVNNNMTATFLMSREVYLRWMEKHGGAIVNIGAIHDLGMPGMGHSGAARAGQANFTMTAAVEWAHAGVRVNMVQPGFIASSGLDRYPESAVATLRSVAHKVPLKRHGTESEIAAAAVFLLSEAAAYVTGVTLRIDGGLHNNGNASFYALPEAKHAAPYNGFPLYRPPTVLED